VSNRPLVVPPSSTDSTTRRDEFPIVDPHQHFWDLRRNYHLWPAAELSRAFSGLDCLTGQARGTALGQIASKDPELRRPFLEPLL